MDRHEVFELDGKVGHVTRHAPQLFKVKRSRSQGHVTYPQTKRYNWAVDGHINFKHGGNYRRGVDACCILSRSVGQTNRK